MNKRIGYGLVGMVILCCFLACQSEYASYVEREMNSGVINDSLIFGMRMGQTKDEFFEQCAQLNADKVVSQGSGANVRYLDPLDSLGDNILRKELLFYGLFDEERIMRGMTMRYSFMSWAPWIRNLQSDSLVIEVQKEMMQAYGGNEFLEIDLEGEKAFVKIDGNRRILMYPLNGKDVKVKIEDLNYKLKDDQPAK